MPGGDGDGDGDVSETRAVHEDVENPVEGDGDRVLAKDHAEKEERNEEEEDVGRDVDLNGDELGYRFAHSAQREDFGRDGCGKSGRRRHPSQPRGSQAGRDQNTTETDGRPGRGRRERPARRWGRGSGHPSKRTRGDERARPELPGRGLKTKVPGDPQPKNEERPVQPSEEIWS